MILVALHGLLHFWQWICRSAATQAVSFVRYAVVDGQRLEASPRLKGLCPGCGSAVTAKCGARRIWHWAHDANRSCDPWWEPETEWHRGWKSLFPADQQEVRLQAEDGEWHIADVRTPSGLVLEFQHSSMSDEERKSRDDFHDRLVWVVDGSVMKRAAKRFERWLGYGSMFQDSHRHRGTDLHGAWEVELPEQWLKSRHPVVFDFRGYAFEHQVPRDHALWALCPVRRVGYPYLKRLTEIDIVGLENSVFGDPFAMQEDVETILRHRTQALRSGYR